MKKMILLTMLLLSAASAGCAAQGASGAPVDTTPNAEVEELVDLVEALQAEGAQVELGDTIQQPFLSVPGQIVKVNGADVQVFEYASTEDMGLEASQVTEDGSPIGTSTITWIAPPHFYRSGRLLVLYVGEDQAVIDLLESVIGPQFAGR
jgi:hypothetical protein